MQPLISKWRLSSNVSILALCAFTLVLALGHPGCNVVPSSEPVERSELIGLYIANYKAGVSESIDLRADSTYSYNFLGFDSSEFELTGCWSFYPDPLFHSPTVNLDSFRVPYTLVGLCYRTGGPRQLMRKDSVLYTYGIGVFKNRKGEIVLERCPDENQLYVKVR